jgi:diguanylate cyclase (GGDEF)-like protein
MWSRVSHEYQFGNSGPVSDLHKVSANTDLPPLYAAATWLFAVLLVGIFALQAWQDVQRNAEQQSTEARRSARYASQIIQRTLIEQRRMLSLFISVNHGEISAMLATPGAEASVAAITKAMKHFFPTAFAFTLADKFGSPLIDDFDGLIGEVCQQNIQHFAQAGSGQPVFIHPHPEVYHYDLMEHVGEHIFFISFKPDEMINALRENASLGQQLFLLKGMTRLIELGPEGSRAHLKREIHLSPEEEAALLVRLPIQGTDWRLVALPDLRAIEQQRFRILGAFVARSLGILILTSLALWFLRYESLRRRQAETRALSMHLLSITDALSGLPNRRALDDALLREWQWMERCGEELTVMMVDVDHFKLYNDQLGHLQGDTAIQVVADVLTSVANRPRDMVGRFGGEEFLVLLPFTPKQAGLHLAENIHRAMKRKGLHHPASPTSPLLTLSIGLVCATPGLTKSPADLLELADQALYAAKASGRNKTVTQPMADSVTST